MSTPRHALVTGALASLTLIIGCSTEQFVAHAYSGGSLPPAELADIEVQPNVRLVSVDGKRVDALPVDLDLSSHGGAKRTLYLMPGTHRLIAGVAARVDRRGSVGVGLGVGVGGGVGVGTGVGSGGDGRLIQGSDFDDEIELDVAAGQRYTLFMTERAGSHVDTARLVLRDRDGVKKAPELQRFIERRPFDDPYGPRHPTTQP